ncbi:MAG: sulfurtransferase complex subunit TusC [Idiomarina sp.]|nr:sulfurtransferase complex subunit TusC [Idiomarina sp.]
MLTIINSKGPWDGDDARNALDMIMMAVSLDQDVQVFFLHDGVYQLLAQQAKALEAKNPLVKYRILADVFEMDRLYVVDAALSERNLDPAQLAVNAHIIDTGEFNQRLQQGTKVVRF